MNAALVVIGLACFAAGGLLDLVAGTARPAVRPVPYLLGGVGSAALCALGVHVVATRPAQIDFGALFGIGQTRLRVDDLSGLFLTLLFGIGVAVSACHVAWARQPTSPHRRGLATANMALLASVAVILTAADAFTFLFAWEVLTLAFYVLTGVTRAERAQASSAWLTLGFGKASGACLLVAFLLLAGRSGTFTIAAWHVVRRGDLHDVAYALLVLGFGAKLGMAPLQPWIPRSYPAAPGPSRAAMAGIAANVGAYGLWRFLAVLGRPPVWLVVAVLLLGGITALLGIAFAGVQSRLSRVIAYSSVENAGIIVAAYGVALAGAATGDTTLETVGLLAASLHVVAHALAKSALFVATANVETTFGTDELSSLRGVGRSLPLAGATWAAGALALAGLPPTVGFVSEWFVLEALMQEFRLHGLAIRLGLAGAGALVALTSGLAALAFLRVLGLAFLGAPDRSTARPRDSGFLGRAGLVVLGTSCLGVAAVTPWEIRYLARGLSPIVPGGLVRQALHSPWVVQPVFRGFSILSPSWLWVVMPVLFLAVALGAVLLSRGRYFRARRVPAWHSASPGVAGPASYTAFGFANPLRHVLANVLGTRHEIEVLENATPDGTARDGAPIVVYRARVIEPLETYLYLPLRRATLAVARVAKRLQSGRLEAYVAYMLIALVAVLALTAALR